MSENYGAVLEHGIIKSIGNGVCRVKSAEREGVVTLNLSGMNGEQYAVGDAVYFFMFENGTGGILRKVSGVQPQLPVIEELEERMDAAEEDIGELQTDVTALESGKLDKDGYTGTAKTLDTKITKIENKVKTGNHNLLWNSKDFGGEIITENAPSMTPDHGWFIQGAVTKVPNYNGTGFTALARSITWNRFGQPVYLEAGKTYTFSINAKTTGTTNQCLLHARRSSTRTETGQWTQFYEHYFSREEFAFDGGRVSFTYTAEYSFWAFFCAMSNSSDQCWYWAPKIEEGDTATAWEPNEGDFPPHLNDLTTGQNLNDIVTVGTYFCGSSAISGSLVNKPYDFPCILRLYVELGAVANYRKQIIHALRTTGGEEVYFRQTRALSGTTYTWDAWHKIELSKNKGTFIIQKMICPAYVTGSGRYIDFAIYGNFSGITNATASLSTAMGAYMANEDHGDFTDFDTLSTIKVSDDCIWLEGHLANKTLQGSKPATVTLDYFSINLS